MSDINKRILRYFKRAGAGSLLISIIVHLVIISCATVYVIQTVTPPRKANFAAGGGNPAADVQHPVKMSNTQPKLEALNKRLTVDTPNSAIALPDLTKSHTGMGGPALGTPGLGGTGGGGPGAGQGAGPALRGPLMPAFGFREPQVGGTLVGRFYDLKRTRAKKPNPDFGKLSAGKLAAAEAADFIKSGWAQSSLTKFFRAPATLYATQIFVPGILAIEAPKAYGVEKEVEPSAWIAHYKGRVSPPATGTYRFVGAADDHIAVGIDGRLVLDGSGHLISTFKTDRPAAPAYPYAFRHNAWLDELRGGFVVGNRMDLRAGQFYDIDIILSEGPGGGFFAFLMFEQEGVTYEKDAKGNPILPIFRIANSTTESGHGIPLFLADGPLWRALPPPKN